MTRRQNDPLRPLTEEERRALARLGRASSEPASHVARARLVLAVADGRRFTAAAVGRLVARFNRAGLAAIAPRHGGGAVAQYGAAARARILAAARRTPDREADGTATWSLSALRRALHRAPDGLLGVSEDTVRRVLREAGRHWQRDRSWCETGVAVRQRKAGPVTVTDPDAAPKNG